MSEIIKVDSRKIACAGDEKANLGHPKIYFTLAEAENKFTCPYCGKVYEYFEPHNKKTNFL